MESLLWLALGVGLIVNLASGRIDLHGNLAVPAVMLAAAALGAAVGALAHQRLMWSAIAMISATPLVLAMLKVVWLTFPLD